MQRTKALALTADADDTGLIAYSDASYAPEGNQLSHRVGGFLSRVAGVLAFSTDRPLSRSAQQKSELVAGLDAVVALQSAEAMLSEFGVSRSRQDSKG